RPPHPPQLKGLLVLKLGQPAQHRGLRDTARAYYRRDPPMTMRTRLRRRPQPPTALIQHAPLRQQPIALPNRTLIDHTTQFNITTPTPALVQTSALIGARGRPRTPGGGWPASSRATMRAFSRQD